MSDPISEHGLGVLALVTDAFGGKGGIARYNVDLLSAMVATSRVDRVMVLPRLGEPDDQTLPANICQLASKSGRFSYVGHALANGLVQRRYDMVFCGHLFMAPLASAIASVKKAPLWLQLHGIEAWQSPGLSARAATRKAALVTTVSRYTRQRFLEWADLAPERVRVLPNTFEPRFQPGPKPDHLIERHDLAGKQVLMTVSRLSSRERYKGHDRIIAALPRILERDRNVVYLIVGDGDDSPRLKALARTKRLGTAVRFAGQVPSEELPDYFRVADLFVMPSTGEGFGIVFLEAAASGLAAIGGSRDGSVDALADGVIGRIVDPDNIGELIDAVSEGLTNGWPTPASCERFARQNFAAHVERLVSDLSEAKGFGMTQVSRKAN